MEDLIAYITGFFGSIWDWLTVTIIEIMKDFAEWLTVQLTIGWIETKIWLLQLSWSVASTVLDAFSVSDIISGYVSGLSSDIAYVCDASGLFDAVNLIIQGYIASIVLRFTGF